jgi:bifunctional non-homologous end joining protein LigD
MVMRRTLPAGFIVPAQPVQRDKPPAGADWVHEIKHDGYRLVIHRAGETVRLWSLNAVDYTTLMPTTIAGAARLKAESFAIDGEAVVIGADGALSVRRATPHLGRQSGLSVRLRFA